jgi:hypothetical protein
MNSDKLFIIVWDKAPHSASKAPRASPKAWKIDIGN